MPALLDSVEISAVYGAPNEACSVKSTPAHSISVFATDTHSDKMSWSGVRLLGGT